VSDNNSLFADFILFLYFFGFYSKFSHYLIIIVQCRPF